MSLRPLGRLRAGVDRHRRRLSAFSARGGVWKAPCCGVGSLIALAQASEELRGHIRPAPAPCGQLAQVFCASVVSLVGAAGLEPARPCGRALLERTRLPVPPGPVCWWLASRRGLEPRFPEPESGVLSVWTNGKFLGRMSLSRGTPGLGTHMQTLGSFHEDEVSSLYDRDLAYPLVILEPCDLRHSSVSCHGALREVDDEVWALPLLPDHRLGDLVRVR